MVERGTVQVRRGPGHCRYNFSQKIPLLPKHCPTRSKELATVNPKQHSISMYVFTSNLFILNKHTIYKCIAVIVISLHSDNSMP